jgi:hypothetical protein
MWSLSLCALLVLQSCTSIIRCSMQPRLRVAAKSGIEKRTEDRPIQALYRTVLCCEILSLLLKFHSHHYTGQPLVESLGWWVRWRHAHAQSCVSNATALHCAVLYCTAMYCTCWWCSPGHLCPSVEKPPETSHRPAIWWWWTILAIVTGMR